MARSDQTFRHLNTVLGADGRPECLAEGLDARETRLAGLCLNDDMMLAGPSTEKIRSKIFYWPD